MFCPANSLAEPYLESLLIPMLARTITGVVIIARARLPPHRDTLEALILATGVQQGINTDAIPTPRFDLVDDASSLERDIVPGTPPTGEGDSLTC